MRTRGPVVVALALIAAVTPARAASDPASEVNVFNGTKAGAPDFGTGGGAGNTFPGPVLPFGMTQFGPDTIAAANNWSGGYDYDDPRIRGFSLKRMSGAGCWNYRDVPITPTTQPVTSSPVRPFSTDPRTEFTSLFSHAFEHGEPGYYRVSLNPATPSRRIEAELTATTRTGTGRFAFPAGAPANVLLNAGGSAMGVREASVEIDPVRREVSGSVTSGSFCFQSNVYTLHFVARFDRPFTAHGTWRRDTLEPGSTRSDDAFIGPPFAYQGNAATAQTGAYVSFQPGSTVEMRVGISFTDVEGARGNLDAEAEGRSFEAMRADARAAWNEMLGRIEIEGGEPQDRRLFYTSLYHALIHPSTFSDADRRYRGFDGAIHRAEPYTHYADFSGWDTYRTQAPLIALIAPREASDMVTSLIRAAQQSSGFPKWSVANGHTSVMTGDPGPVIVAGSHAFGARDFLAGDAVTEMLRGGVTSRVGTDGYVQRPALRSYLTLGYIPFEHNANNVAQVAEVHARSRAPVEGSQEAATVWGSSGTTLEYAVSDHAIAFFGARLGVPWMCETNVERSRSWRGVFDAESGYARPRLASGAWVTPFDPTINDPASTLGFAEGNAAQYTFMVPHDAAGLADALGGPSALEARLDHFFTELNAGFQNTPYAFLGNEPSMHTPWLYAWTPSPWKAQEVARRALLELYDPTPSGYPGNDDLGAMSSWVVWTALGMFPFTPGTDLLVFNGPLFPRATVHRADGDLVIEAPGASRDARYVHGVTVDGLPSARGWIYFEALRRGATLSYEMGDAPAAWPAGPPPPSLFACDR